MLQVGCLVLNSMVAHSTAAFAAAVCIITAAFIAILIAAPVSIAAAVSYQC